MADGMELSSLAFNTHMLRQVKAKSLTTMDFAVERRALSVKRIESGGGNDGSCLLCSSGGRFVAVGQASLLRRP